MQVLRRILALLLLVAAVLPATRALAADLPLERIQLPPGFSIALWAQVENPREMTLGRTDADGGTLFVGSGRAGKVHAVRFDGALQVKDVRTIASGLKIPMGVAYKDGNLYVSAVSRIVRFDDIERQLDRPPVPVVVTDKLASETHHGGKFLAFGPDGKLYVPTGAPCNVCEPDPRRYAQIARMNPDGSDFEVFAQGIRNSVGFDWDPRTRELWFTDNGRDLLGDEVPPDELNHAARAGLNFGYPYCHGGDLADPEFGAKRRCDEFTPPARKLGPHVASLGMRFYTGTQFPAPYQGQIFIAEHGSWNRSHKIGYRISVVRLQGNQAVGYETFASGWLQGESVWGRPADLQVLPDGSLLVADDYAGAIYRVTYRKP